MKVYFFIMKPKDGGEDPFTVIATGKNLEDARKNRVYERALEEYKPFSYAEMSVWQYLRVLLPWSFHYKGKKI